MPDIFSRSSKEGEQAPAPAAGSPRGADETALGPRADAPVEAKPADAPGASEKPTPIDAPEIVPGVPLWTFENPYGDDGIAWLASLDLDAKHEVDQPAQHPGTDLTPARPLTRSGGAAYYVNLLTGRGFSVPIAPEGT